MTATVTDLATPTDPATCPTTGPATGLTTDPTIAQTTAPTGDPAIHSAAGPACDPPTVPVTGPSAYTAAAAIRPPSASRQRRIAHLDMDAFFASVTLLQFPQLRDLPVVIGGSRLTTAALLAQIDSQYPAARYLARLQSGTHDAAQVLASIDPAHFPHLQGYHGRGVTTTATYAARRFGLGSGMGLTRAARLCPQAILLPPDFDSYLAYSRRFKAIVLSEAPVMEDRGIDEVFIDFTELPGVQQDGGHALATRIQQRIQDETGLSCSIGVAPNKLLAKMASDFDKPHGITMIHPQDLQTRIWPLPCRLINGIGPRTDARLQALGIGTIAQLAACALPWLVQHFGARSGQWLHDVAWGRDDRPVANRGEPVSISRETTFERDLHAVHDRALLGQRFTRLAERTAEDLQRKGYAGRTVGIKLRYADFRTVTRDLTVDTPTQDAAQIRRLAGLCLKRVDLKPRLRLLGIRVSSLSPYPPVQEGIAGPQTAGIPQHAEHSQNPAHLERPEHPVNDVHTGRTPDGNHALPLQGELPF